MVFLTDSAATFLRLFFLTRTTIKTMIAAVIAKGATRAIRPIIKEIMHPIATKASIKIDVIIDNKSIDSNMI